MRPLLSIEHDEGYDRYLYVQVFDKEELARARMSFARYQNQGVIRDGSFNDEVYVVTEFRSEYAYISPPPIIVANNIHIMFLVNILSKK